MKGRATGFEPDYQRAELKDKFLPEVMVVLSVPCTEIKGKGISRKPGQDGGSSSEGCFT